jgi:hypothetical protein
MAKIQEFSEIVRICEQKKQTGDYTTVANILGINVDTARMRVYRKDEEACNLLYRVIQHREALKEEFKKAEE